MLDICYADPRMEVGMGGEPAQAAVDEDTHGTLSPSHDLGDLGDRQVAEHPQQHGFRLIGWEGAHQRQRGVERVRVLHRHRRVGLFVRHRQLPLALGTALAPAPGPDVVDAPAGGDREQPSAEVRLVAVEPAEPGGDLDPDDRRQIVRVGHALAAEVPQEQMLVRTPQVSERVAVTGPRASNHLVHAL